MTDISPTGTPPGDRPFRHRIANPQSVRLSAPDTPPGQVSFEEYDRATRDALRVVTRERDEALERVASVQQGAGAWVREAVARATAALTAELAACRQRNAVALGILKDTTIPSADAREAAIGVLRAELEQP